MAASSLLTPFHSAEPLSSADFLAALKASPAGAKEIDAQTGNTPLHFAACGAAPLPVVSALLAAHKKAAGVLDKDGNLPIHGAVANGAETAVVEALLTAHPEANTAPSAGGPAALSPRTATRPHWAGRLAPRAPSRNPDPVRRHLPARCRRAQGVRALQGRHTLLHSAACNGATADTVRLLLERWPEAAAAADELGNTPLHFAAACKAAPDVVELLIAACPSAAATRGQMGRFPLSLALLAEAPPGAVDALRRAHPAAVRDESFTADYLNHGVGLKP